MGEIRDQTECLYCGKWFITHTRIIYESSFPYSGGPTCFCGETKLLRPRPYERSEIERDAFGYRFSPPFPAKVKR